MKRLLFLFTLVSMCCSIFAADEVIVENFSGVGNVATNNYTWEGDVCTWDVFQTARRKQDTISTANQKQAIWMSVSQKGAAKITSTNLEGGIKAVSFKYARFGKEATAGRVLQLKVTAGDMENSTPTFANNAMKQGTNGANSAHEEYVYAFNNKTNAQLSIENSSTYTEELPASGICRILVGDITITPYLLYTIKEAVLDTRNALTYTHTELINNTDDGAVVYTISPADKGATIDANGQVTATDETEGEFVVTASWEGVTTTYTLAIVSRTTTNASYPNATVRVDLADALPANELTVTDGYDGVIAYTSSNTEVATVGHDGVVTLAGGVGQTTITATLPQTNNYKAASAQYTIYVEDKTSLVEAFSMVEKGNAAAHAGKLWQGDVCAWRVSACGGVRKNEDVFASDQEHVGVWMGTPAPNTDYSSLTAENGVEGGIKHLWFYCEQPFNTSEVGYTLQPVVYINAVTPENMVHSVEVVGAKDAAIADNRKLFGVSNVMKSNSVLIIRNESYQTDNRNRPGDNRGRFLLDNIHITPYLLYGDKSVRSLRLGDTYFNNSLINNTAGETGTLSYDSSNESVATVSADGMVTAVAFGETTITAKYTWSATEYVTTSYKIEVYPVACETFSVAETDATYATAGEVSVQGDKCLWHTLLGGVKTSEFEPYVAIIRAVKDDEDMQSYLYSDPLAGGVASLSFDWNLVAEEEGTNWDIRIFINGRMVKQLTDADITVKNQMPEFENLTITGIDEPGNFVIRFENHSTRTGAYSGNTNKGRFVIDNIAWEPYAGTKTIAESADNSAWLAANDGAVGDVTVERSVLIGGVWNTLCMPFALSRSVDLEGTEVQEMVSAEMMGNVLVVGFAPLTGDALVAGKPYLVKPSADLDLSGDYTDVTITNTITPIQEGIVTLTGVFSPFEMTAGDQTTLFVGMPDANGDNLFYPGVTGAMKGMRAYFKLSIGQGQKAPARARFVVNQQTVETGVDHAYDAHVQVTKQLQNGQLIIVREGVKYNTLGQIIDK